jgi:hypothetical protein
VILAIDYYCKNAVDCRDLVLDDEEAKYSGDNYDGGEIAVVMMVIKLMIMMMQWRRWL